MCIRDSSKAVFERNTGSGWQEIVEGSTFDAPNADGTGGRYKLNNTTYNREVDFRVTLGDRTTDYDGLVLYPPTPRPEISNQYIEYLKGGSNPRFDLGFDVENFGTGDFSFRLAWFPCNSCAGTWLDMSSSNTSVDGDDDEHHVENQGWANSNHDANWEDGYYRIQIYDDDGDDFSDFWAPKFYATPN